MPGMLQPQRKLTWSEDGQSLAKVEVRALFSGAWYTMTDLPVTRDQWDAWQAGDYIQRAMPNLSADQREFLMSGTTPEHWDIAFHLEDPVTYRGVVSPGEGDWRVYVEDEERSKPLPLCLDQVNHSPDGFSWGYGGSGPAQLSLAILADAVGSDVAVSLYQRFKREVVAAWPQRNGWTYTSTQAQAWAKSRLDIE